MCHDLFNQESELAPKHNRGFLFELPESTRWSYAKAAYGPKLSFLVALEADKSDEVVRIIWRIGENDLK